MRAVGRVRGSRQPAGAAYETLQARDHCRARRAPGTRPRRHYQIDRRQRRRAQTKRFPDQAPYLVATDRRANRFRSHRKAQARTTAVIGERAHAEQCIATAAPVPVHALELDRAGQALTASEAKRSGHGHRRRPGAASGDQTLAALGAAALEHQAALLGGHARAKAVSALAADFARLIRAFCGHGAEDPASGGAKSGETDARTGTYVPSA